MNPKVLIACEQSQVVCAAFRRLGCECFSNDIVPTTGEHPEWHIVADAAQVINGHTVFALQNGASIFVESCWDLIIAHPPCQCLSHVSAVAKSQGKQSDEDIKKAVAFFKLILASPTPRLAVENPAPIKALGLPRYNQIIQPYDFGHPYSKRVCLWLKNLPPLLPTHAAYLNHSPWLKHCSGRPARRARTFDGIADAMANQWGALLYG